MPMRMSLSKNYSYRVVKYALSAILVMTGSLLYGQTVPQGINYQAIVRDTQSGQALVQESIYLSAEFLTGQGGDVVYAEEFPSVQTGTTGLINLSLGQGQVISGVFSGVPWSSGDIWLRISIDAGQGLTILQETAFQSVPYAFHSGTSDQVNDDPDPTNELVQVFELINTNLSITEGGITSTVDLASLINDPDFNPENELIDSVTYNIEDGTLKIFEAGQEFSVNTFSPGDGDNDPTNEIQGLTLEDNTLTITLNEDVSGIDLSPYLDNTDNQDLELSGTTLSLTGDPTTVDLSGLPGLGDDADADPSNELQELTLSTNNLNVTNNPSATPVDLSPYLDNTDNQDLQLAGTNLSLTGDPTTVDLSGLPGLGDDADADPSNELQELTLSSNNLNVTNNPSATPVDLSPYDNSALSNGRIFVGNASNEAQEVDVTGDVSLNSSGEATVTGLQSVNVGTDTPTDGQVLVFDATDGQWEPGTVAGTSSIGFYSIDPLDFEEVGPNSSQNADNVLKFFDTEAPFAYLRNGVINTIAAPVHLPHGAEVNQVRIYFHDGSSTAMQFVLARKDLTSFSTTNQNILFNISLVSSGDNVLTTPIFFLNTIDNSQYTYRLFVQFSDSVTGVSPDLDQVDQRIYGVVIRYTL